MVLVSLFAMILMLPLLIPVLCLGYALNSIRQAFLRGWENAED